MGVMVTLGMGSCLPGEERGVWARVPAWRRQRKWAAGKRKGATMGVGARVEEELLSRVPGRLVGNGESRVASLFTQQGRKGVNQDAMIFWERFGSREDTAFCGVFDGHGPFGHLVAGKVRDILPLMLSANIKMERSRSASSKGTTSVCQDEASRGSGESEARVAGEEALETLAKSILTSFRIMDKELSLRRNINSFVSGTTAVTLIKQGEDLLIGNLGDSRAVLGTRDQRNRLTAVQLTVDLKPDLPAELERIKRCKGRVFPFKGEPHVARLWRPNHASPGLAMARAFGDFCLKDCGLISVPEIYYRRITERDEFIVLATDGVWEVLSNREVVKIVASAPDRASAARHIVEAANRAWSLKLPNNMTDDCTAVCLYLNTDTTTTTTTTDSSNPVNNNEIVLLNANGTLSNGVNGNPTEKPSTSHSSSQRSE
ncbi:putative protein phosphatase 2C 74 [Ananas comosus]|uniref:protein-serine/threonine phosphatase n=1 Tax=Ananas comosus TaxID=4615 RepID=A0A199VIK3_ANACO|nr:putative protein phosphatase 2C 74 [Ananas comosus]